ncbi:hypothetical protein VTN77DRAFT_3874 [Rasamsonia byssochlamydoides]|uniref:uncharacterized protein n=1 Tax=Rasamsonia byssochlamydoides TaxID=89139 RepID=UPI003743E7D4
MQEKRRQPWVIPDSERPQHEQDQIKSFRETITDFNELPSLIERATRLIGLDKAVESTNCRRAFAKDMPRVEIEGPK